MRKGLYSFIKALLVIFMATLLLSPSVSSAFDHCTSHSENPSHEFAVNDHSDHGDSNQKESHECACPTHRVGCCHYQVTPPLAKLNLVSLYDSMAYGQKIFVLPASPLLEGPFQPPRG